MFVYTLPTHRRENMNIKIYDDQLYTESERSTFLANLYDRHDTETLSGFSKLIKCQVNQKVAGVFLMLTRHIHKVPNHGMCSRY